MTDTNMRLRTMQIMCFGFIMGMTMIIIIFGAVLWSPEPKVEGAGYLFHIIAMAIMGGAYMAGIVVNKIQMAGLIKKSIAKSSLDLDAYQQLMIMRIALLEAPALVSVIFFVFLVGGSPVAGPNILFLVPVVVFYLGIIKVFPTRERLERIEKLISEMSAGS